MVTQSQTALHQSRARCPSRWKSHIRHRAVAQSRCAPPPPTAAAYNCCANARTYSLLSHAFSILLSPLHSLVLAAWYAGAPAHYHQPHASRAGESHDLHDSGMGPSVSSSRSRPKSSSRSRPKSARGTRRSPSLRDRHSPLLRERRSPPARHANRDPDLYDFSDVPPPEGEEEVLGTSLSADFLNLFA